MSDTTIGWLIDKFKHPLSLLFFVLGAVLILLVITTGFEVPLLKRIAINPGSQIYALIIGPLCLIISVWLSFKSSSMRKVQGLAHHLDGVLLAELTLPILARESQITDTQRRILKYVQDGKKVNLSGIQNSFPKMASGELFYRMEHLRLLGFLERDILGQDRQDWSLIVYRLSQNYKSALASVPRGPDSSIPRD